MKPLDKLTKGNRLIEHIQDKLSKRYLAEGIGFEDEDIVNAIRDLSDEEFDVIINQQ